VALKFLPDDYAKDRAALERFQRRHAPLGFESPQYASFTTLRTGARPFLAMELLEGQTLRERIAASR